MIDYIQVLHVRNAFHSLPLYDLAWHDNKRTNEKPESLSTEMRVSLVKKGIKLKKKVI